MKNPHKKTKYNYRKHKIKNERIQREEFFESIKHFCKPMNTHGVPDLCKEIIAPTPQYTPRLNRPAGMEPVFYDSDLSLGGVGSAASLGVIRAIQNSPQVSMTVPSGIIYALRAQYSTDMINELEPREQFNYYLNQKKEKLEQKIRRAGYKLHRRRAQTKLNNLKKKHPHIFI